MYIIFKTSNNETCIGTVADEFPGKFINVFSVQEISFSPDHYEIGIFPFFKGLVDKSRDGVSIDEADTIARDIPKEEIIKKYISIVKGEIEADDIREMALKHRNERKR